MKNPTWLLSSPAQMTDMLRGAQNQADELGTTQDVYVAQALATTYELLEPYQMISVDGQWFCYFTSIEPNSKRLAAGR